MRPDASEFDAALASAVAKASAFLGALNERPPGCCQINTPVETCLEEEGVGAACAIERLWDRYGELFTASSGPRYWGFVHGGVTPAALAADWICSTVDQVGQMHGDSPSVFVERDAIAMLRDLFGLPPAFTGNFVSGGTMANVTGLAIGLQALGAARGVNVSNEGLARLGSVRILSGESHASIAQAAAMLGLGRESVKRLPLEPGRECVSVDAMARRLEKLSEHSIIIVGNAGTVNTGDFDDFDALATLAETHSAHFHVDGAFGLFAALSPRHAHLVRGVDRAGTIACDAHKWLNVPYDSGFVFTRHLDHQIEMFKSPSAYLPARGVDPLAFQTMSPENSRRLRALPAWATLQAYGRSGHRAIVDRCCALAEQLGERIATKPAFKLLTSVRLNIVCFQLVEGGSPANFERTAAFVERVKRDGRLLISRSELWGQPCIRVALVNWRTTEEDIEIAVNVLEEMTG